MAAKNSNNPNGNKPSENSLRLAEKKPERHASQGPLTDKEIKNAPVWTEEYRMHDPGTGLYLLVKPNGAKWWRFRYRFGGTAKQLSMGVYPKVSLAQARAASAEAKALIAKGIDPGQNRKDEKAAMGPKPDIPTFGSVAEEWFKKNSENWVEGHIKRLRLRLNKYILPFIGKTPIADLKTVDYAKLIGQIEDRNLIETAKRVGQLCGQVTRYARTIGLLEYDTAAGISAMVLKKAQETHFATITDPLKFGRLLLAMDDYHGAPITRCAIRILPYVFVRSGELRGARWAELDFEKEEWTIPAERMKMKRPHVVPLAPQVIKLFRETQAFSGDNELVFPGLTSKTRPLSDVGLLNVLRRIGYGRGEMTIHGFRSAASTMLNEMGYNRDWIEMQLAHAEKNAVRDAYNRAQWLPERKKMMCEWADYIDSLKEKARNGQKT